MSDKSSNNGIKIAAAQAELAGAEARLVSIELIAAENRRQIESLRARVVALEAEEAEEAEGSGR